MSISEWYRNAPKDIREWMETPVFRQFAREQHQASFQTIGAYDGAMSEECKKLLRRQYEAIGELRAAISSFNAPNKETDACR